MKYTYDEFMDKLRKVLGRRLTEAGDGHIEISRINCVFNDTIFNDMQERACENNKYFIQNVRSQIRPYNEAIEDIEDENYTIRIVDIDAGQFISAFMEADEGQIVESYFPISSYSIEKDKDYCLIEILCRLLISSNIKAIEVVSKDTDSNLSARSIVESYLFSLSLNKDIAYILIEAKDVFGVRRRIRGRRNNQDCFMPKRKYNQEIVRSYQMAKSTNIPFIQYLSYYHVLEYFFNTVFEEQVLKQLQNTITSPKFNYKNLKDYRALIKIVNKDSHFKSEHGLIGGELTALKLAIGKFVDMDEFKDFLKKPENDYFCSSNVIFQESTQLSVKDSTEGIIAKLAKRIYATRNSLVHSKEGEKVAYQPFKHDKKLSLEIPLIKYIAEEIIINSGKPL